MIDTYEKIMMLKQKLRETNLKFNTVISSGEVEEFEQRYKIILPEEYKLFIQCIGNGGDGPPEYGIKPLGTNESWWYDDQRKAWFLFENIHQPFTFSEQWIWENDEFLNITQKRKIFNGNIYLGTEGCGIDWVLIVTGEQRGFVWQITDIGITPCKPAMTFLQWFIQWLDYDKSSPNLFWWEE